MNNLRFRAIQSWNWRWRRLKWRLKRMDGHISCSVRYPFVICYLFNDAVTSSNSGVERYWIINGNESVKKLSRPYFKFCVRIILAILSASYEKPPITTIVTYSHDFRWDDLQRAACIGTNPSALCRAIHSATAVVWRTSLWCACAITNGTALTATAN